MQSSRQLVCLADIQTVVLNGISQVVHASLSLRLCLRRISKRGTNAREGYRLLGI